MILISVTGIAIASIIIMAASVLACVAEHL
jgi:hypothetical protein